MNIASRVLTRSGAWLRRRAVALAEGLMADTRRFATQREFFDGFMLEAKRSGNVGSATVTDFAAWLMLSGRFFNGALSSGPLESQVLTLARGRDTFLEPPGDLPVDPGETALVASPFAFTLIGAEPTQPSLLILPTGETASKVKGLGVLRGFDTLYADGPYTTNPMAFVSRAASVEYRVCLLVPQAYRGVLSPSGPRQDIPVEPGPKARLSLLVSDSFMRDMGALPFCMRVAPPPYDPSSTLPTEYNDSQAPWHDAVAELLPDGVLRVTMWAHTVFDMLSDSDRYGARGLWIATIVAGEVVGQVMIDLRAAPNVNRRPEANITSYRYNAHLRAGGCCLDSGLVIIVDPFVTTTTATGGVSRRYMSLDLHWIDREGALVRSVVIQDAFRLNTGLYDMHVPIGIATDGETAVVVLFTSVFTNQPSALDIAVADDDGASVALSLIVPFYPCLGATPVSRMTTGRDDNSEWTGAGAGGNQVCYIGNDKYLFYVSSVVSFVFPSGGNWAAAIYDAAENTVELAGVINGTVQTTSLRMTLGTPDCVRQEQVDPDTGEILNKATVIATRGGFAQLAGYAGTEFGETWISYDSGESWELLASQGSPAGAFYCGNIIQPRAAAT